MCFMLMLLPKGRGNKKEQWEEKSVGVPVPNCFPGHNGTMPGNSVRCSTIRNSTLKRAGRTGDRWRNIAITLIDRVVSVNASMRRPVGVKRVLWFFVGQGFLPPSRHCRHPSIRTVR